MNMLIGITGGIGSGKSALTEYLRSQGEAVICADEVAKEIVQPGQPGAAALREVFGDEYFLNDGELDRRKFAAYVFGDMERVAKLNGVLHPIIITTIFEKADRYKGRVFIDAALLIQTGINEKMDYVWLVVADLETRISRVMKRDAASRDEVLKRIENQMSDDDMKRFADEVIENNESLVELQNQISTILGKSIYTR